MSEKTLSTMELEITQKMQMHFPWGSLPLEMQKKWNACKADRITARLLAALNVDPDMDVVVSPESLLRLVGTVEVPAMTENIFVSEYITNLRKERKVYTGSNFERWFFGKKMEPISKSELRYHELLGDSVDDPIIAELGGEKKAETSIDEFLASIKLQANGESGALLNDGSANIFYIKDIKGVLRAVYCSWSGGGWVLIAYEVGYPDEWNAGRQVFSRNSKPSEPSEAQS